MVAAGNTGMILYKIYRALTYGLTPLVHLHLLWRRRRGLEHPTRWPERLGRSSLPRPSGPLIWFHAVSLGEGMAAIPVIKRCVHCRPDLSILMTTTTFSAFEVITNQLPSGVLYQFSPVDTPTAVDAFLDHWKPNAIILLESELWPNLIMGSSRKPVEFDASSGEIGSIEYLKGQLASRHVWMASSIHRGEEKVMLGVHRALIQMYPDLVTIIVPRYPQDALEIAQELHKEGLNVALRSQHQRIMPGTQVYMVDTLGELRCLYSLSPVAVIGGSFFPGLAGHNISEAAAAGCAVLTGHHVGHFSHMVKEMQRLNPLSITQVSGTLELEEAIKELLNDAKLLEARRMAAKQAFHALSSGIIANVWNLLNFHVLEISS